MTSGVVHRYDDAKGSGLILPDDGSALLFAHFSQIVAEPGYKTLHEGARVTFDVTAGPKGRQAENIREVKS